MEQKLTIGLDNPTLSGRLRQPDEVVDVAKKVDSSKARFMKKGLGDVWMKKQEKPSVVYQTKMVPGERVAAHVEHIAAEVARKTFEKNLQPATTNRFTPKIRRRKLSNSLLYVLALLLFAAGSVVTYQAWRLNKHFDDTYVAAESTEEVAATGDEKQSDPNWGAYTVDPALPKLLRIPKFEKTARIMHLGVDENNAMMAPYNVHDAGWFNGSALPGKKGAAVISGHISGPTQHGVFYDLTKLVNGDEIEIERGDGKVFKYKVIASETQKVGKVNMTKVMTPQSDKPGLNLITCAGDYNRVSEEYDSRHIVYTQQVN